MQLSSTSSPYLNGYQNSSASPESSPSSTFDLALGLYNDPFHLPPPAEEESSKDERADEQQASDSANAEIPSQTILNFSQSQLTNSQERSQPKALEETLKDMIATSLLKAQLLPSSQLLLFAAAVDMTEAQTGSEPVPHILFSEKISYPPGNIAQKDVYAEFEDINFDIAPNIQKLLHIHFQKQGALDLKLLPEKIAFRLAQVASSIKVLDLTSMPFSSKSNELFMSGHDHPRKENQDLASLFRYFPHLESLSIHAGNLEDAHLWQFTRFSNLKYLQMTMATKITPSGLSALSKMRGIKEIRLENAATFYTKTQAGFVLREDSKRAVESLENTLGGKPAVQNTIASVQDVYAEFEETNLATPLILQKLLHVHAAKTGMLNLSHLPQNIHEKLLKCAPSIKALDLSWLPLCRESQVISREGDLVTKKENQDLKSLLQYFSHLEILFIHAGSLDDKNLWQIAEFSHLKELRMLHAEKITPNGLKALSILNELQAFRLDGTKTFVSQNGKGFKLHEDGKRGMYSLVNYLPRLSHFILDSQEMISSPTDDVVAKRLTADSESAARKKAKIFTLQPCHLLTDKILHLMAKELPNAETIELKGCFHFTEAGIEAVLTLPKLKTLELQGRLTISDGARKKLKEAYPHISMKF